MKNNINQNSGGLVVFVSTGSDSRPIEGAMVSLSRRTGEKEQLLNTLYTDKSGKTPIIYLSTPNKENSLSPDGKNPYSVYNIRVDYPGYYTVENVDVPVFSENIAIQPVNLIPLPLDTYQGKTKVFYESDGETLNNPEETEEEA